MLLQILRPPPLRAHIRRHQPVRVPPAPAREHPDDAAGAPTPTKVPLVGRFTPGKILCCPIILWPTLRPIRRCHRSRLATSPRVAETSSGGSKKIFAALAVLVVAAVGVTFAWTQFHEKVRPLTRKRQTTSGCGRASVAPGACCSQRSTQHDRIHANFCSHRDNSATQSFSNDHGEQSRSPSRGCFRLCKLRQQIRQQNLG